MPDSISALTIDLNAEGWKTSRGFIKRSISAPILNEQEYPKDALSVIIKVHFAGMCGSDRGIWHRQAFTDMFKAVSYTHLTLPTTPYV